VLGGQGGAATGSATAAGAGGSVKTISIQDELLTSVPLVTNSSGQPVFITVTGGDILVKAGDGGSTTGTNAAGAAGGSVVTAALLAAVETVQAGNGSAGKTGGAGGALTSTHILDTAGVAPTNLTVNAGYGGFGSAGNGGAGGAISALTVDGGQFVSLTVNTGLGSVGSTPGAGNGGGRRVDHHEHFGARYDFL
jgi:hypothetical protein